ncbi:DUF2642 domain-containing protein [Bacillus sp. B15-48]|uniref:DUF2642 domain-containing protein n=1 Tax=Bacillus sp. B15-48 TaxID=1548601 RepID=UPI00193F7EBE|nr:DUF2642 domain-containing protein [Bacillus sp. B15-48]MBM4764417.1 DUF2642 domain-containing protein [Bacillus sp. B15-48]
MAQYYHQEYRHNYENQEQMAPTQHMNFNQPYIYTAFEPFLYHTLRSMLNQNVIVEAMKGTIRGVLSDVHPDHIVLHVKGNHYYIRTQHINWVMPTHAKTSLPQLSGME